MGVRVEVGQHGWAAGDYRPARGTTVFAVGPPSQLLYSRVLHLDGIKDLTLKADMDIFKRMTWTWVLVLLSEYHVKGTECCQGVASHLIFRQSSESLIIHLNE